MLLVWRKFKFLFIAILVGAVFTLAYSFYGTFAQELPLSAADFFVEISPLSPGPNEEVEIFLNSYVVDVDRAMITWFIEGEQELSGRGEKNFQVTTPGAGDSLEVVALISPVDGGTYEKRILLSPSNIDIVWEAQTYTPPFYKGKAMPTRESTVKFVAIPDDSLGGQVVYEWKKDFKNLPRATGFEKNTLEIKSSILDEDLAVQVTAESLITGRSVARQFTVPLGSPEVAFYVGDLGGVMYEEAVSGIYSLDATDSVVLVAEPYGFSYENSVSDLVFKWTVNGEDIETPNPPNRLTLRTDGGAGVAGISVEVNSVDYLYQEARASIQISF